MNLRCGCGRLLGRRGGSGRLQRRGKLGPYDIGPSASQLTVDDEEVVEVGVVEVDEDVVEDVVEVLVSEVVVLVSEVVVVGEEVVELRCE